VTNEERAGATGIDVDSRVDLDEGDEGAEGAEGAEDDDDVLVLPWWQHPFNIAVIAVTAALLAGIVGWMIGDAGGERDANEVDVGFLQDMRDHHEQAVGMSFLYLAIDDTHPGLRAVARSIAFGQGIDIGRMIQILRDLGEAEVNEGDTAMGWMGHDVPLDEMPGLATDAELDELAASTGADADALFVELMVRHHEAGIDMAEYAADHASDGEVRAMAESIVDSQGDEITELERLVD
jgi:uncharacterized protein (DUF305 family)